MPRNIKNNSLIIYGAVAILLAGAGGYLLVNRYELKLQQLRQLLSKTEAAASQLEKEKSTMLKENEKLQVDALSHVALNNDLQKEKDSLQQKLQELQKTEAKIRQELLLVQNNLDEMQKLSKVSNGAQKDLLKEKEDVQQRLKDLESAVVRERGIYHYNLAVAYTKAMLINKAVPEYEKSLEFDPRNAEAHYNLALLYKGVADNPEKAVAHLQRYLELKPDAEDAEDVRYTIEQLKSNRQVSSLKAELVSGR